MQSVSSLLKFSQSEPIPANARTASNLMLISHRCPSPLLHPQQTLLIRTFLADPLSLGSFYDREVCLTNQAKER